MSPASHLFFVQKPKNSTGKKYIRKCREETLGQVFSPAGKIPRLCSDIRQSYLICFYCMRAAHLSHLSHAFTCDIAFVAFILGNVVRLTKAKN